MISGFDSLGLRGDEGEEVSISCQSAGSTSVTTPQSLGVYPVTAIGVISSQMRIERFGKMQEHPGVGLKNWSHWELLSSWRPDREG